MTLDSYRATNESSSLGAAYSSNPFWSTEVAATTGSISVARPSEEPTIGGAEKNPRIIHGQGRPRHDFFGKRLVLADAAAA